MFKTQKVGAQLIRGFRDKTKERLKAIVKEQDQWIAEAQKEYAECGWLNFKKKRELRDKVNSLIGQGGATSRIFHELDKIGIK